jgi:hypothetical protein
MNAFNFKDIFLYCRYQVEETGDFTYNMNSDFQLLASSGNT